MSGKVEVRVWEGVVVGMGSDIISVVGIVCVGVFVGVGMV